MAFGKWTLQFVDSVRIVGLVHFLELNNCRAKVKTLPVDENDRYGIEIAKVLASEFKRSQGMSIRRKTFVN